MTNSTASGLVLQILLKGVCWTSDDLPEAVLTARDVRIESEALLGMTASINTWVGLPLEEQKGKPLVERFVLVKGDGHLELRFGPREDMIASGGNPILTVVYDFGRLRGQFSFQTDQSCLRQFGDEIRALALRS
ncbi:MAG TPA: hypothetical protein VKW04_20570 [Planctomycetota bacterium]|nr:hypothetical protein [Planctomycetota bacterium]